MLIATVATWQSATAHADFPKPSGHVNDFANLLNTTTRAELESLLTRLEADTTAEVAVATVTSLDGMTVEEYAHGMFQDWGVGQRIKDNGVLIVVAPHDRAMRIEVGYGLETILPDGLAGAIVRDEFLPYFRADDYQTGLVQGVRRVANVVRRNQVVSAEELQQLAASSEPPIPWWITIPFAGVFVGVGSWAFGLGLKGREAFLVLIGLILPGPAR